MKITDHFHLAEFESRGEPVPPEYHGNLRRLCESLEVLRAHIDRPITIISGWRSQTHNGSVGGAPKSQHLTASAADIRVSGMHPELVAATIEGLVTRGEMTQGGLHAYSWGTHYDVRGTRARWR